jgi:hypothetical protein
VLNNGRNKFSFHIDSPLVAHVGYDISPLKRAKLKNLTISP